MSNQIIENYLSNSIATFRSYKGLADRAMVQVSDEEFFRLLDAESNSIATIVKHVAGNLKSRWTDFLTTDGEKPDRNRDEEFVAGDDTRESLMAFWESSWEILFSTLNSLKAEDFAKTVTIRQQPHAVSDAINRQLAHYSYHIGQITFLAKHLRSEDWKTLSVPKNKSSAFNSFISENKDDERTQMELAAEFNSKEN